MKVGLFGGSFDPVHDGHLAVSHMARARVGLDQVWWLFSPQNPLKSRPASALSRRMTQPVLARLPYYVRLIDSRRYTPSLYTIDLVTALQTRHPATRFIWIMGMDGLVSFHRWHRWHKLWHSLPLLIFDRPGYRYQAMASRAAISYAHCRIPSDQLARLPDGHPPVWGVAQNRLYPHASRDIRARMTSGHDL